MNIWSEYWTYKKKNNELLFLVIYMKYIYNKKNILSYEEIKKIRIRP